MEIMFRFRPSAQKMLLYFVLTQVYNEPFKMTLWEISQVTEVKNPFGALQELAGAGIIRKHVEGNSMTLTLLVDLVVDYKGGFE
jgi:hypothetical protein